MNHVLAHFKSPHLWNPQRIAILGAQFFVVSSFFWAPSLSKTELAIGVFVYFLIGCVGGTVTYHRLLSHRAFRAPRWFRIFGSLCGVYGFYGSPLAWASVHRDHHRWSDTEKDPHSPLFKPWWDVQIFSFLYTPRFRNIPDLTADPFLRFVHKHYLKIHVGIILILVAIDPFAVFYAYLWPAFFIWHFASSVNVLGHLTGYRNFQTKDSSRNNWWLSLLVFGEGWHNNHHAHPARASFSSKWWEIDPGNWIVNLVKVRGQNGPNV